MADLTSISFIPFGDTFGSSLGVGAGVGGGFYALKWLVELMTRRLDKREERIDAAGNRIFDSLSDWAKKLEARVDQLEHLLIDCQKKHAESEAEVLKLRALMEAKGIIAQQTQIGIAANKFAEHTENPET